MNKLETSVMAFCPREKERKLFVMLKDYGNFQLYECASCNLKVADKYIRDYQKKMEEQRTR